MDEASAPGGLPIDEHLPAIVASLRDHTALVLQAPPGAGKTTRVPPALWRAGLLGQGSLIVTQPRRLAARAAARRIASEQGWTLGAECGYHVRFDRRAGRDTRLLCVTEGVLLQRLQQDAVLGDVSAVILDEFHERRLDMDVLLGMLHRLRTELRPELLLIVMSATLEAGPVATFLECPILETPGRGFPVRIAYRPPRDATRGARRLSASIAAQTAAAVADILPAAAGHVLAFLPGEGEIRQARRLLEAQLPPATDLLTLYGAMSPEDQDRVLAPGPRRKIVLATNVAETSITIEGVTAVVDSGWARVMRFDPQVGLDRLQLERISLASAEQRAGRAGRTEPGVCWRLWDEAADRGRTPQTDPEIQRVDLCGAVLQLHAWGESDIHHFPWLQPPREDAVEQAELLLQLLGALDASRSLTLLGRQLSRFPAHPRLGRLLLAGRDLGVLEAAGWAAAILSERDPLQPSAAGKQPPTRQRTVSDCDLCDRIAAVWEYQRTGRRQTPRGELSEAGVRRLAPVAAQFIALARNAASAGQGPDADSDADTAHAPEEAWRAPLKQALLAAFPDRLARRRGPRQVRGRMVGGRGVQLNEESLVQEEELFLCLDCLTRNQQDANVRLACGVPRELLPESGVRRVEACFFHPSRKQVVARLQTLWFDLLLDESPLPAPSGPDAEALLFQHAQRQWAEVFPAQDQELQQTLARIAFLREVSGDHEWPEIHQEFLESLLREMCHGRRSFEELKKDSWLPAVMARLSAPQHVALHRDAPTRLTTPSGRPARIVYEIGKPPVLQVKIQDAFGWRDTPRIAGGRHKLLLHLLAPNMRCQQVTDDLASFWQGAYHEVRKELKRRYSKHPWPEDPCQQPDG